MSADGGSTPSGEAPLFGCALHARIGKTCCQTCDVLVTEGDRRRIRAHTGREGFWEQRAPEDPAYLDQDDDPNWRAWTVRADGTRPVLRRRPNGDCTFLGARGCTLPTQVRPLVCRLFPYAYTERGIDGLESGCPQEVIPTGRTLLEALGMVRADAEGWHRMLYAELRSGQACDETGRPAPGSPVRAGAPR